MSTLVAAGAAQAQDYSDVGATELVYICEEAHKNGDTETGDAAARALLERPRFNLSDERRALGAACLERAFGFPFVFSHGRFRSPAMRDAQEQAKAELKRQRAEKGARYTAAVISVCFSEYEKDLFRALTTPVCAEVFKEMGLPE
ncbi:MAG: hypothetical protein OIF47_13005 [Marinibacterium sp.]|nr:hypothetical protein [Marinibacterium sp.]